MHRLLVVALSAPFCAIAFSLVELNGRVWCHSPVRCRQLG